jgi:hypothetical protein
MRRENATPTVIARNNRNPVEDFKRFVKKMNFSTVWRWALKGVHAVDGRLVKLEAARVGGRWLTSKEALARFSAALTPTDTDAAPIRTPTTQKKAGDAAKKRLKKMGI